MTDSAGDAAALAAMARAFRKGWPARMVERAAPGWAELFLVALRGDPEGRHAVAAALLDEATLIRALREAGLQTDPATDPAAAARALLDALARDRGAN